MYYFGFFFYLGYLGVLVVDFDLEEYGWWVKLLGKWVIDKENGVWGEYWGKKEVEMGEIVEIESGFGLSLEKWKMKSLSLWFYL